MKMRMKINALAAVTAIFLLMGAGSTPQQDYIRKYAPTAVREMYRSGVPASITLAQGILESRAGLSELASKGNNHFGIKCHSDWKGRTMKVDDDRPGECFRVYEKAEDSFADHSDFLRYKDRYKFLFEFETTDYLSWANGLKKAGYATDPSYAGKLVKIIEDYGLSVYDRVRPESDFDGNGEYGLTVEQDSILEEGAGEVKVEERRAAGVDKKKKAKAPKARHNRQKASPKPGKTEEAVIPESPNALEAVQKMEKKYKEEFHFSLSRDIFTQNGVPFIRSMAGETYSSVAEDNNLFLKEILHFNDLEYEQTLEPGTTVYLQAKKKSTRKGLDKYIVDHDGESLRDICQRFGVRMSSISKLNGFVSGHELKEGDTILLRANGKKK